MDQKAGYCDYSLVVQWLELCAFTAGHLSSVPHWGTEIPQAMPKQKKAIVRNGLVNLTLILAKGIFLMSNSRQLTK